MMQEVLLSSICDLKNGFAFKSKDYVDSSNTLSCRMSSIRPGGNFDLEHNQRFLPDTYAEVYSDYLLKDGDIVIAMTDLAGDPKILGVPTIVNTGGKKLLQNQRVGKLVITDSSKVFVPYLQYALNRPSNKSYYKKFAGGGLQINVSKKDILNNSVPLPPLDQQKKIAAILDSADTYRQKTKALIEKYDELTQSLFLDMFGDPVSNPKGWDVKTIGDCFNVKGGKRLPKGSEYETIVTKHAYIRVKDFMANGLDTSNIKYISEEIHDKISRYTISSNDVYISIAGTIGLSGYVPEYLSGANLTENAAKLIPKKGIEFRKEYLSLYLNSDYAQQNIKSKTMAVGVPKLALFRIQELPYIDAPINAQDIFVRRVQAIEAQKAQAQASLAQAEDLFNSLLQRAFKGELTS